RRPAPLHPGWPTVPVSWLLSARVVLAGNLKLPGKTIAGAWPCTNRDDCTIAGKSAKVVFHTLVEAGHALPEPLLPRPVEEGAPHPPQMPFGSHPSVERQKLLRTGIPPGEAARLVPVRQ